MEVHSRIEYLFLALLGPLGMWLKCVFCASLLYSGHNLKLTFDILLKQFLGPLCSSVSACVLVKLSSSSPSLLCSSQETNIGSSFHFLRGTVGPLPPLPSNSARAFLLIAKVL